MNSTHISVLLEAAVEALEIRPDGRYLDATFGRGGHSRKILTQLGAKGRLFAVDRDLQAAEAASALQQADSRFTFFHRPFSEIGEIFAVEKETFDGILFDLGVSSPQLDQAERGFSFQKEGPLDMRMDCSTGISAADWLLQTDELTLMQVIRDFGGEPHTVAKRLAKAIFAQRERLKTTLDLAELVIDVMPKKLQKPGHHPATQTFQAIRMAVNDEVGEIKQGLLAATDLLKSGGLLAVITFHSLEDGLVKRFIRQNEGQQLPAEIPTTQGRVNQRLKLLLPVIKPSKQELADNPRARSARLRKAVRL